MQTDIVHSTQLELDYGQLLLNLKKAVELWFLIKRDCNEEGFVCVDSTSQIESALKSILLDGLEISIGEENLKKLVRDLNWLNSSSLIHQKNNEYPQFNFNKSYDVLSAWLFSSLKNGSLCASLQHLVADRELLESYYNYDAFLRNDRYATALFICLSAFELNQSSLISQIDPSLYIQSAVRPKHKRSRSHPHFSLSPKKYSYVYHKDEIDSKKSLMTKRTKQETHISGMHKSDENLSCVLKQQISNVAIRSTSREKNPMVYRRCKSLPNMKQNPVRRRQRSRTISQPIKIPNRNESISIKAKEDSSSVPGFVYRPYCSESTSSDCNNTASTNKTADLNDLVPIQLVKCDDIQIHFDQSQNKRDISYHSSLNEHTIEYDSPPGSTTASSINLLSCIPGNMFSPIFENISKEHGNLYSNFSVSAPTDIVHAFLPQEGEKLRNRFSNNVFEDFIEQCSEESISEDRIPLSGQSLASFLQTAQFSRNNTDLERENAHFKISEAIISVIEQIKSTKLEEETKATLRRNKGGSTNTNTNSSSSLSDIRSSEEDISSTDLIRHKKRNNLLSKSNPTINDYVAYAEWGENLDALSAEGVALSIISKFSDKKLPRASDITWLVSEEDAPQKLLPMPGSPSADPDENCIHSFTRGTRDWAPPRQQVIFTDHSPPNRRKQMQKQNFRCAGCGMKVAIMYTNRFRYCTYFGRYHCTGCHRNQISTIPAKVLNKWDFAYYPVSSFAYKLLEQIWTYPLFYIPDLNPSLYSKVKSLHISKIRRIHLKFVHDFIKTCRFADNEKKFFVNIPSYLWLDPDKWAMSDFVATKNGILQKRLLDLISKCEEHIFNCVLCTARGFICELCPKKQIIFPWQTKVKRCDDCGSCFHHICWRNRQDCSKCQRLRIRKERVI